MELSGLQIFKHLPGGTKSENANCKKCGFPTCMAFALKLAQGKAKIEDCEFVPDELKTIFAQASKVKQHEIVFGSKNQIKTGGEQVMFRHDKTFINRTVIAISLNVKDANFAKKFEQIKNYSIERVGETFKIDAIELIGNDDNIFEHAKMVDDAGFAIISTDARLAKFNPLSNIVKAANLEELERLSTDNNSQGKVLELDVKGKTLQKMTEELTHIRRLAILNKHEPFTHPTLVRLQGYNEFQTTAIASVLICRYANILVLEEFNPSMLSALFTLRQNIFTDPQKPLQVESQVYEINEPDENSLVLMTTNFALTYFAVANEVESLSIPAYLAITPSDGMSVLTAWSADKFNAQIVAKMVKSSEALQKVKNKCIIIPGLLSHMKAELEEVLENWRIEVGPNEVYHLPEFIEKNEPCKPNNVGEN